MAAKDVLRLIQPQRAQRRAIHFDDSVARSNPRIKRRAAGDGGDDGNPAVAHVDARAHSDMLSRHVFVAQPQEIRRQIRAVRILELLHEAAGRVSIQCRIRQRIDVLAGYVIIYLVEQTRAATRSRRASEQAALDEPAPGNQSTTQHYDRQHCT